MIFLASGLHAYGYESKGVVTNPLWTKAAIKVYDSIICDSSKSNVIVSFSEFSLTPIDFRYTLIGVEPVKMIEVNLNTKIEDVEPNLLREIETARCIIVNGGNTFNISYLFHTNGWYNIVWKAVKYNHSHYIGYSAGAIMATPTVMTAQWADSITNGFLENRKFQKGFNFVDFCLKPHSDSYLPDYYQYFKSFSISHNLPMKCIFENGVVTVDKFGEISEFRKVLTIETVGYDEWMNSLKKRKPKDSFEKYYESMM